MNVRPSLFAQNSRRAAPAAVFAICASCSLLPLAAADGSTLVLTEASVEVGLVGQNEPSSGFIFAPTNLAPMLGGGAVGDFNADGAPDFILVGSGGQPDQLFINDGTGHFTEQAADWGIAAMHKGLGVAVGDYDDDGWDDVFMCGLGSPTSPPQTGQHRLYHNNGDGSFTDVATAAGVAGDFADGLGCTFGDYDLDGDLDLCVACWTGAGNRLFRNDGDGTFTDVTIIAGIHDPSVRGFSPAFVDMNRDRYPELLVAADYGTSRYYVNNGDGTFTNQTVASGTGLDGNGMGHTIADFDRDGRLDWYVTSIHSVAPIPPDIPGTGNMLYMGVAAHQYDESSLLRGVNDGGWGWGTVAVDLNHDGFEDIVETNGWPGTNGNFEFEWTGERSYVFLSLGGIAFLEIGQTLGVEHDLQGRGLVTADFDLDGDMDLVFMANDDQVTYYRNDLAGEDTNWLHVRLDTDANPALAPRGVGTRVMFEVGNNVQTRFLHGGSSYLSQSERAMHVGLGAADVVDRIVVEWSDGTTTELENVQANQRLVIQSGWPPDLDGSGTIDVNDLLIVVAAWGQTDHPADLDGDGVVAISDLLIVLGLWGSSNG